MVVSLEGIDYFYQGHQKLSEGIDGLKARQQERIVGSTAGKLKAEQPHVP